MDDRTALDWTIKPKDSNRTQPPGVNLPSSAFAPLRPTPPTSGRSTPLPNSFSHPPSKSQPPANDSFSNLITFSAASANKNLSLQEQQKRRLREKAQQQVAKEKQLGSNYNGVDEQFWNNLGSGRSTPAPSAPGLPVTQVSDITGTALRDGTTHGGQLQAKTEEEDDILAAFKADTPVDSSTHFPKPAEPSIALGDAGYQSSSNVLKLGTKGGAFSTDESSAFHDDDDPFGLAGLPKQSGKPETGQFQNHDATDNDDVLGLLGKPVSEILRPQKLADLSPVSSELEPKHPQDQAIAELVEMGFPVERAREALESTVSGTDVQQAVGWLLNRAHFESRKRTEGRRSNENPRQSRDPNIDRKSGSRPSIRRPERSTSAWSSEARPETGAYRQPSPSPNELEKDSTQMASEFGTAFLKTAGSLWKTSTKKVQQAVQEFNSDSDSSQPRWMKEPGKPRTNLDNDHSNAERTTARARRRSSTAKKPDLVTDEAMMLESDRARPPPRKPLRRQEPSLDSSADNSRDHSPAVPSRLREEFPPQPAFLRQPQPKSQPRLGPKAALNRQTLDDQASQAYVSSARRRKPASNPPISTSESDLLEIKPQSETLPPFRLATTPPRHLERPTQPTNDVVVRPTAPSRHIPQISAISLKASHAAREAGNDQFKRGDYSTAHQSYTLSMKHLPVNHPISIILSTNRALTALKIGEPKSAVSDSEAAISVIGPSRGETETIDLANSEPPKPMREYFGKALMRKAEALEQMEKWEEAALVWKTAAENGHGGTTSIQGRARCEKSAAPKHPGRAKTSFPKKPIIKTPPRSFGSDLNGTGNLTTSAAAVSRLRAANAAADRVDDEKFALADTVDARLTAWKGGKADNLRALLSSLDTVLWPEAGWKKIGMAELVLPTRVKVHYMKGISKVHPDKVSGTHTTFESPRYVSGTTLQ
jgi:UBA/TS-N domain